MNSEPYAERKTPGQEGIDAVLFLALLCLFVGLFTPAEDYLPLGILPLIGGFLWALLVGFSRKLK